MVVCLRFNWTCAFWLLMSFDNSILHPADLIPSSTHLLKKCLWRAYIVKRGRHKLRHLPPPDPCCLFTGHMTWFDCLSLKWHLFRERKMTSWPPWGQTVMNGPGTVADTCVPSRWDSFIWLVILLCCYAQGLLLALYSRVTPGSAQRTPS